MDALDSSLGRSADCYVGKLSTGRYHNQTFVVLSDVGRYSVTVLVTDAYIYYTTEVLDGGVNLRNVELFFLESHESNFSRHFGLTQLSFVRVLVLLAVR